METFLKLVLRIRRRSLESWRIALVFDLPRSSLTRSYDTFSCHNFAFNHPLWNLTRVGNGNLWVTAKHWRTYPIWIKIPALWRLSAHQCSWHRPFAGGGMNRPVIQDSHENLLSFHTDNDATRVVFDVGMNNGDDSAYYLSKGYRVVAVEANPILVERACKRFEKQISAGQFRIEGVGICDRAGKSDFWINDERDVFSSFERARAVRDGMNCHSIEVECITFDTLLEKYGVPYYVKLDVEGVEASCLKCLQSFRLPQYVSVEAEKLEYLQLLWQLGYREFAIVDQARHNSTLPVFTNETMISRLAKQCCWCADRFKNRFAHVPFPRGCSGPLAEEARFTWSTFEEVAYNWLHLYFGYRKRGTLNPSSWYDFHAKTPASPIDTAQMITNSEVPQRTRSCMRLQNIAAGSL